MSTRVDKPNKVISGMTLHVISARSRPNLVIWVVHAWKFHMISVKSRPILISVMNLVIWVVHARKFHMISAKSRPILISVMNISNRFDMFITLIKIGRDFAEIM